MRFTSALATAALAAVAAAVPVSQPHVLQARAWNPLPVGSVTPKGWLLKQLKLQADGLSGHLSQFWNDVENSIWVGGNGDGGLHERAPYWLNGIVPLAYLLKNAGADPKTQFDGIYKVKEGHEQSYARRTGGPPPAPPVSIMDQSNKYITAIMKSQEPSGWLGPNDNPKDGNPYWGRSNVMFALSMYAEAEPTRTDFTAKVMLNYALELERRLTNHTDYAPLQGWAAARWMDIALGVQWLLANNQAGGNEATLTSLLDVLHKQGSDWESWFETLTCAGAGNGGCAGGHNVNNAQALKSAAVLYLATGNETLRALSKQRMKVLDEKVGLPSGMFNGDEIIPSPNTRNPSRGIELCGVVEAMFSYNTMFSVHGDVEFADRAEKISYNALPATWASPTGGDMWAHQYLQAINEINAINANPHAWTHDGGAAETYGLEPNYGCCTANFNQGWPKFASMIVYSTADKGAAIGLYAPSTSKLPDGSTVDIDTSYPYEDEIRITVDAKAAMPLYVRIPGWAVSGTTINGKAVPAGSAGTMLKQACTSGKNTFVLKFTPKIKVEQWGDKGATGASVTRGVLLYTLPIVPNYTVYGHHFGGADQSNDYELRPTSPWQYALDVNPDEPSKSLTFASTGYVDGSAPFNHSGWPVTITATVRKLPSWGEALNSAAPPPQSPACVDQNGKDNKQCGTPEKVTLVPYGGTELRIGEFPITGSAPK
jgi:hypothetical protein